MSRAVERIDPIVEGLRLAWKANPDMRLTQLVWALGHGDRQEHAPGFFYREDEDLRWEAVPMLPPWPVGGNESGDDR